MGKRKLTAAEKAAKKRRRAEFQTVFINGKMKRVRRPPTIDGMSVDEFIRRNADPIFLHEMGMWELMEQPDAPEGGDQMGDRNDFSGGVRGKYPARHSDFTLIVEPDGDGFVSFCDEFDVWSQGATAEEARANLAEALELFLETVDEDEIRRRLGRER
ncbi:MAG TPA: type II toxin-antitoxin system HicB family antitoxin [Longimicrobium sp.]|nr:type II toxin-antitoxin system HicB family antitoxin [Longimicrobium sp.]